MNKLKNMGVQQEMEQLRNETSWSNNDKLTLLRALKKYEHTDYENISKMLPNKQRATIKKMIDEFIIKSRTVKGQIPINDWLESGLFIKNDSLIPLALHFIQLFEKHPPLESGVCDYSSIYNFLYCLTLGKPAPDLQLETKKVLCSTLNSAIEEVWPNSQNQILEYAAKLHKMQNIHKVYSGKKKFVQDDDDDDDDDDSDDDDNNNDNDNDDDDDDDHDDHDDNDTDDDDIH